MGKPYRLVATGGTFDVLHKGHRALLDRSFEVGEKVIIGITSDELARKLGKEPTNPYRVRRRRLEEFLASRYGDRSYEIHELRDYFGPAVLRGEVEALVASPQTGKRVELANAMRRERGLKPLELVTVDYVLAEDGLPISTTRIRRGEIDEEGRIRRSEGRGAKGLD